MKPSFFWILFLGCGLGLVLALAPSTTVAAGTLTVGVVTDGPSRYFDKIAADTLRELRILQGEGQRLRAKRFDAGWRVERIAPTLEKALGDPSLDLVFADGVLTARAAMMRPGPLPKPVVAGLQSGMDVFGVKVDKEGRSLKPNLCLLYIPGRIGNDLAAIKRMVPDKTLYIMVDAKYLEGAPEFPANLEPLVRKAGFSRAIFTPIHTTARQTLDALDARARVVYLTPPMRMPPAEEEALIAGLNQRKLVSFSMEGKPDVERGVLAGLMPDVGKRLARRAALNIQQIAAGVFPNQLPATLYVEEQLFLNCRTARLISYWPDFTLALDAVNIDCHEPEGGNELTLKEAMLMASSRNLEIEIQKTQTEVKYEEESQAQSYLLPQIYAQGQYQQIDPDRADASFGAQPESQTTAGATLSQMLYDDEVISRWRASGRVYEGSKFEEGSKRLDLMEQGALRYLDYLIARALAKIQRENLKLVQKNLELARVRVRVGMSGKEEVYRLLAEEARRKSSVLEAYSRVEQALVVLNQTLNVEQMRLWRAEDVSLNNPEFFLLQKLTPYIKNDEQYRILSQYLVKSGLGNSQELKALDKSIEAQEIQVAQLSRTYFLPKFHAQLNYSHTIDKEDPDAPPVVFTAPPPVADRDDWSVGITASFPLFEGNRRAANLSKARAELRGLAKQRERTAQLLERRIRTVLDRMAYSEPNIMLSQTAYQNAAKNFKVVQDKYAQGEVSIIDLLDAQNEVLTQEQSATLAVYRFLSDYIAAQRAVSWFEVEANQKQKEQWFEGYLEYYREQYPQ